jgi:hypothetical protein
MRPKHREEEALVRQFEEKPHAVHKKTVSWGKKNQAASCSSRSSSRSAAIKLWMAV